MKMLCNHKKITRIVLVSAIIAMSIALCMIVLYAGNPHNRSAFTQSESPKDLQTSAPESEETALDTTIPPDDTSAPEMTYSPEDTAEPATTTNPEETAPDATAESAPEPEVDEVKEYIGVVYLTFDDGPSSLTPKYLDVLKDYGVNATFFVLGVLDGEDWKIDIMKRALDEGNQLALHGYSHDYAEVYQSTTAATNNFYKENQQMLDALGIDIRIIRFPGGSSNTISKNYCKNVITDSAKILTDNGYNYFDWNVSSSDAGSAINSSEDIYNNVINGVRPSKTNVVLMHDCGGHQATLDALPQIIEWLLNEGYEFKIITDETPSVRHPINN